MSSKALREELAMGPCDRGVKKRVNFRGVIVGWRFSLWPLSLYDEDVWEQVGELNLRGELSAFSEVRSELFSECERVIIVNDNLSRPFPLQRGNW